jgi:hypothetical protein
MFARIMWVVTFFSCLLGALVLVVGVLGADGAPQEAAAAAVAVALAVIPYCFTKSIEGMDRPVVPAKAPAPGSAETERLPEPAAKP